MHELLLDIPLSLETDRLHLRCYKPGDGEVYFPMIMKNKEHLSNAANPRLLGIESKEEAEIYLRELINDWNSRKRFVLGVWNKENNKYVVEIWIEANDWKNKIFEIGWFVNVEYQGKGYVTEAAKASLKFIFENLGAHKVIVTTGGNNPRSYSVAERCRFVKEGCHRQQKKLEDGNYRDTLYYGLLRSEYKDIYE
ncbi:GNAT family N-acetyltransferase [Clostridium sp. D2Q-11]|uniref:GNAT family N-acetyltransferase n=1 Tax=Anaeromonas frigoriresistens TaxID=2683708 RepID=A0A942URZ7_9FIRM|nr:GNAT family protein [Anaeromonas frigoriresistens]MBS4537508.1 GNAT family N-acetyltransferase [Anaeromonas frigoriresistens]